MKNSEQVLKGLNHWIESRYVYLIFIFLAVVIFSPFVIYHHHIVSTTDSVFNHYPNLLFGYDELKSGHLPLWNPYLLGGEDFTRSMHNHMLNPVNWVLLLFPKGWIFQVLTGIELIEIALIGVMSFKIFQVVFNSRQVSFISALVVQLSGFTWFVTATFIGVEFFLLSILFIYLILTYYQRRKIVNFLYMTLLTGAIFMEGHVGYIAAFFLPVIVIQGLKHYKHFKPNAVFSLAALCGLVLALYRIYPILMASETFNVIHFALPPPIHYCSEVYHLLTGFMPAIFGVTISECIEAFTPLLIRGHNQFHNFLYYGIAPIFILFLSISGRFKKKITAHGWITIYLIVGSLFVFQPATDFIYLALFSLTHDIIYRVGVSFLIFALFARGIHKMYREDCHLKSSDLNMLLVVMGVVLCAVGTYYMQFNLRTHASDSVGLFFLQWFYIVAIFGLTFWAGLAFPIKVSFIQKMNRVIFPLITMVFALLGIIAFMRFPHQMVQALVFYHLALLLWSFATVQLIRSFAFRWFHILFFLVTGLFCLYTALFQLPGELRLTGPFQTGVIIALAGLVFVGVALSTWEIFARYKLGEIGKKGFILVLSLLLMGDLIFCLKIYSYSGGSPFVEAGSLYPKLTSPYQEQVTPDIRNYRMNYPGYYLNFPYANCFSNAFFTYQIRTIGGVDSVINRGLWRYVANFVELTPEMGGRGMVFPGIMNARLEEVFGIKYSFPLSGEFVVRPKAASRFSAFSDFAVIEDKEQLLSRLKDPEFAVDKVLLLNQAPEGFSEKTGENKTFTPIHYTSKGANHLTVHLDDARRALILFNDTYDKGWTATWQGEPLPILLANGYFMAVSVPAELGTLEFTFHPPLFFFFGKISIVMGGMLFLLGIYVFISRKPQQRKS